MAVNSKSKYYPKKDMYNATSMRTKVCVDVCNEML